MSADIPILVVGLVVVSLAVILVALRRRPSDLRLPREDDLEIEPEMFDPTPDRHSPVIIELPAEEVRREPPR